MFPDRVEQIVGRQAPSGMEAAGRFLAAQQKGATRSRRLAKAVSYRTGRDHRGWWARAGMIGVGSRHPAFFWYFEEYQSGRGGGVPFIRPSLENNRAEVARLIVRGG
jgi:hypothetical protein